MEIQTERFWIRELRESDIEPMKQYQGDTRYLEYYEQQPDAQHIVTSAMLWAATSPRINFQLAISLTRSSELIGNIGVSGADYPSGEAELGIEINPAYWNEGYARVAISHMLQFSIQHGIKRLHAVTNTFNIRAINLVQSFGFSPYAARDNDALYELYL